MGMRATYRYLSDKNLKELKSFYEIEDNISEEVEDSNEEMKLLLDIDKIWDVPHFVFTGVSSLEPIKNDPWIALTQSSESEAGRLRMHSFTLPQ